MERITGCEEPTFLVGGNLDTLGWNDEMKAKGARRKAKDASRTDRRGHNQFLVSRWERPQASLDLLRDPQSPFYFAFGLARCATAGIASHTLPRGSFGTLNILQGVHIDPNQVAGLDELGNQDLDTVFEPSRF